MADNETIASLRSELEVEKKKNAGLANRLASYEENGPGKLYYSLNRKAWEMADMLNKVILNEIDMADGKDKTFERIRYIINDSSSFASAVKELRVIAGITGDEEADTKRPFIETVAEKRP